MAKLIGEVLGGYVLERVVGEGGMGCVYLGRHKRLGRRAAVKVLDDRLARSEEFVSRFFHEAKSVADMRHPSIVDIIDFVEQEQPHRVAYVMEFLEGVPLNAALKQRRLTPAQALNITSHIASALAAVHALGIVHRDLKPGNVILRGGLDQDFAQQASVKILDFGIAKISDPLAGHRTSTGAIMGTPIYMAPEQVSGDPVSGATDVYALGELLFEMVAGRTLFSGSNTQVLKEKLTTEKSVQIEPAEVRTLVSSCVRTDPGDRPTLSEIQRQIERAREGMSGGGGGPSRTYLGGLAAAPVPASEVPPPRTFNQPSPTSANSVVLEQGSSRAPLVLLGVAMFCFALGLIAFLQWRRAPQHGEAIAIEVAPIPPGVAVPIAPRGEPAGESGPAGAAANPADESSAGEGGNTGTLAAGDDPEGSGAEDALAPGAENPNAEPADSSDDPAGPDARGKSAFNSGRRERSGSASDEPGGPRLADPRGPSSGDVSADAKSAKAVTKPRRPTPTGGQRGKSGASTRSPASPTKARSSKPVATGTLRVEAWTTAGRELPATVFIDGKKIKKRTPFEVKARAGTRRIEIRARGHAPVKKTIKIRPGRKTDLPVVVDLNG